MVFKHITGKRIKPEAKGWRRNAFRRKTNVIGAVEQALFRRKTEATNHRSPKLTIRFLIKALILTAIVQAFFF